MVMEEILSEILEKFSCKVKLSFGGRGGGRKGKGVYIFGG
jgi:hypothetical protein